VFSTILPHDWRLKRDVVCRLLRMTDFWRGDDGRITGRETGRADEELLTVATLGLVREMQVHLLRRWAGNRDDEHGDLDDGGCGADEGEPCAC
jgi:hypothetical protein